jgi:hypothetical protein
MPKKNAAKVEPKLTEGEQDLLSEMQKGYLDRQRQVELPQLPTKHGDRPRRECVHAVGSRGHRDVLILIRVVGILHKS